MINQTSEKGITMIAIIITIIILIILSAVTISAIQNVGLFGQIKNATEQHKIEQAREKLTLALDEYQIRLSTDNSIEELNSHELYNEILRPILMGISSSTSVPPVPNMDGEEIVSVTVVIDGYTFIIELNPLKITGGSKAKEEELVPIDTTPPIITLNGSATITIALNDEYVEQGAKVIDDISIGLTVSISGSVNTSKEGTYSLMYLATDEAGNEAIVRRTVYVTSNLNLQRYAEEMAAIEALILSINENAASRIGTALTKDMMVTIRGINYYDRWYKLTAADVLAINSGLDVTHAPYIVRYEYTEGAVISIAGEVINSVAIHTFNYTGDPASYSLYTNGLLTAVTQDSTKSTSAWGEATIAPGGAQYGEDGGLILGDKIGFLSIDKSQPVGDGYTINVTVKGSINQTSDVQYGSTIIAISDVNGEYLAWVRLKNGCLQVITYLKDNQPSLAGNTKGVGYMSKTIPEEYNNNYMNIQITSQKGGRTQVYLNGELFEDFQSGSMTLSYGNMTIGDLRPARGLKFTGSVYNFALYSQAIDHDAVTQNWNYFKDELGI